MTALTIGPDTQVTLHFAIEFPEGGTVDSTFNKTPATFVVGDGNLLPGFEAALHGLKPGDETAVTLSPEKAFGPRNPDNIQRIGLESFEETPSEGLIVSFADAAGSELPGVVDRVEGDQVYVDFNHPLAGRELIFKVSILSVIPAPEKLQ